MKRLAAALTGFVVIATAFSGCDSSTGPTTVTLHDTLRIHDTTYYNDRFTGTKAIVHGQWRFTTTTDTADATIFQIGDSLSVGVTWKKDGTKSLKGLVTNKSTFNLSDPSEKYKISGTFKDSANHMITRFSGNILDIAKFESGTGLAIDSIKGIRTF